MQLKITRTLPIYRSPEDTGVFLQWDITDPISADMSFSIERSVGPEGPWELIIAGIRTFHFFDNLRAVPAAAADETRENINHLSLVRAMYYRVTGTADTGETTVAVIDLDNTLPTRQFLLQRKMRRDLSIGFKFNALNVYVLKRKHWGVRCKNCFDLLTKKVTNSKCNTCYGTGFEGGYAYPVEIKGRFTAPASSTDLTPQGLSDTTRLRFICADYPNIDPYDVIVQKNSGARYVVQQQSQTELRRNLVHQALMVSELSRDSVEYRITVNTDSVPVIY